MKRNHLKYLAITFGRVEKNPVLTCEGTVIPIQDEMELLGVTIHNKLRFKGQICKICRKVSQQVDLNRLKKILPFELRIDIHHAFIAPHFNYCSESWHHCGKRGSDKLEKVNERALCFVTCDKSTTYETLLKQLNLLSPFNQRIVKMATSVYKAIHGYKVPTGIGELLRERSTNYNLRGKHILELPKVNTTTYGLKLWRYAAAKIWNTLLDQFCAADKIRTFKNLMSMFDFSNFTFLS